MNRNELPSREYLAQFHRAADGAFRVMKAIIPRRDETTIEINEKSILVIRQVDQGGESHVIEFALDDAETLASEIQGLVCKYRKPFFNNPKVSGLDMGCGAENQTQLDQTKRKQKGFS